MNRKSNYDKYPTIAVTGHEDDCVCNWPAIGERLRGAIAARGAQAIVVDTYPGVLDEDVLPSIIEQLKPALVIRTDECLKPSEDILAFTEREFWADDAVFGRLSTRRLEEFFDSDKLSQAKSRISQHANGLVLIYGVGGSMLAGNALLVYADMARWEIQMRQRRKQVHGIGVDDSMRSAWEQYKRGFFIDWRVTDRHKRSIWDRIDFFLDTNDRKTPKLATANAVREGIRRCTERPFRVVPFFDPGVWGGQWMKEVCDLDRDVVNFAWCFDCVPEENSLLLGFGQTRFEIPSINLVHQHPRALLGEAVYGRFGAEFPIRFDFLDTMNGGNLSLQVHPLTDYIQQTFGMPYTQDESYYMLDAADDACVYLGFRDDVDPTQFVAALEDAQANANKPLDAEKFVNRIPAKKHDHFLIPAGTIHCSGKNSMVLEISATPYIFTFKLWDWGRVDLNGKPRPISIAHGKPNLDYARNTQWTKDNLVNQFELIAAGPDWREERTGLYVSEFIETRRHWFSGKVTHQTNGGVNVLNLVEGEEAIVESPSGAFEPFIVHYAETFIIPAAVTEYTIRPSGPSTGSTIATMKAFVRSRP